MEVNQIALSVFCHLAGSDNQKGFNEEMRRDLAAKAFLYAEAFVEVAKSRPTGSTTVSPLNM